VQPAHERGAAAAPEPSLEPSREPSAARAPEGDPRYPLDNQREAAAGAGAFYAALGPGWPLTAHQRTRLAPPVAAALAAGWTPAALAQFAGANTGGVRSPYAVLAARLSPGELPAPPGRPSPRPPWCGSCNQGTRLLERGDGRLARCPRCHPLAAKPAGIQ